jgi:hypothetical protein
VQVLELFDGQSTELDLRQALVEITGQLAVSELESNLIRSLDEAGFLDNATYHAMREDAHRAFAEAPVRLAAHAGTAYPDEAAELHDYFTRFFDRPPPVAGSGLVGIAAPHASPEGARESYRDAYRHLGPEHRDRVFVILGTSHQGHPGKFGLTRKDFETPAGLARTDRGLVDWLEAEGGDAVLMEDYCHASEHSIEFQVAFLQHRR